MGAPSLPQHTRFQSECRAYVLPEEMMVDPADYVKLPYARLPAVLQKLKTHILGIPYNNIEERYIIGPELGAGLAGVIRYCVDRYTGEALACKTLPKGQMVSIADIASVRTEVLALRRAGNHPAVAGMRAVAEDEEHVHIVMELGEGGDLFDRIQQRGRFTERNAALLCRSLFSVVHFCHSKGLMHRDIKPENILLTSSHSDTSIKLVDFGQSVFIRPGMKLTHPIGTPYYIAPEVLDCSYGLEADVWSLGVVLYVLLCGVPPFWEDSQEETFEKIRTAALDVESGPWREISSEAKDLVSRLLCRDPAKRITLQEAKVHPWILQHCTSDVLFTASPRAAPDDLAALSPSSKRARCIAQAASDIPSLLTISLPLELAEPVLSPTTVLAVNDKAFLDPRSNGLLGMDSSRTCAVEMKNTHRVTERDCYKDQMGLSALHSALLSAMMVQP